MLGVLDKLEALIPEKKIFLFGKNSWMNNTFPYYMMTLLILLIMISPLDTGFFWIFVIYAVLPMMDEIFAHDIRNPSEKERQELERRDPQFKLSLYSTIIVDWIFFFRLMNLFETVSLTPINIFKLSGLMFIASNLNAVQFAVAH